MKQPNTIISQEIIHSGQWVELAEVSYYNREGNVKTWECVHRKEHPPAAVAIAKLLPSETYILIKQFRPATGKHIIEFPAGLVDPNEDPIQTAVRELKEETGYSGVAIHCSPPLYTSPGVLSEVCYLVNIEVDETLPENQNPTPCLEPEESIEVLLQTRDSMSEFIKSLNHQGYVVDAKLYTYFEAEH